MNRLKTVIHLIDVITWPELFVAIGGMWICEAGWSVTHDTGHYFVGIGVTMFLTILCIGIGHRAGMRCALLAAAEDKTDERPSPSQPLHAHEITEQDAAFMRAMAGANFGGLVTLPSGRTIDGAELNRWVEFDAATKDWGAR